jgi:uncharacterized membrane protein
MAGNASVTPGRWIGIGWDTVKADLGNCILITVMALLLATVGNFIVAGPLIAGLFISVRRRMLEGRTDLGDLFAGFNFFIDAFLIFILISIFALIGLVFLVLPALVVIAVYLLPFAFLVDRKLSFWAAMEASRKLVVQDLLGWILFVILLILLNLLGLMLAGIGLLVTIPVTAGAIAAAYRDLVGFAYRPPAPKGPIIIP